ATLKELISQTMVRWSQEDQIQDPELVRIMYSLLRRQYDSIGELLQALRKAYTISAASVKDTINLLAALGQIRSLLSVRMGKEEELLMINGLGYGINRILFLITSLVHIAISKFFTSTHFSTVAAFWRQFVYCITRHIILLPKFITVSLLGHWIMTKYNLIIYLPFAIHFWLPTILEIILCFFFDKFMVDSSCSLPILSAVVTYLAGCGLQSCPVLLAKGYPDIGWNPIEGERYLSFLRFAVFANSESVEENASVVVKLLIR
ncbi:RYR3 protein, partial [Origma solitaria]|nr:RYR3 protein [Origma solitaria]